MNVEENVMFLGSDTWACSNQSSSPLLPNVGSYICMVHLLSLQGSGLVCFGPWREKAMWLLPLKVHISGVLLKRVALDSIFISKCISSGFFKPYFNVDGVLNSDLFLKFLSTSSLVIDANHWCEYPLELLSLLKSSCFETSDGCLLVWAVRSVGGILGKTVCSARPWLPNLRPAYGTLLWLGCEYSELWLSPSPCLDVDM